MDGAATVARATRHDVDVNVGHGLSGRWAIVDADGAPLRGGRFSRGSREASDRREEGMHVFGREVFQELHVGARNHQDMTLRERGDVQEGERPVILRDHFRGDLSLDDPSKNAAHG